MDALGSSSGSLGRCAPSSGPTPSPSRLQTHCSAAAAVGSAAALVRLVGKGSAPGTTNAGGTRAARTWASSPAPLTQGGSANGPRPAARLRRVATECVEVPCASCTSNAGNDPAAPISRTGFRIHRWSSSQHRGSLCHCTLRAVARGAEAVLPCPCRHVAGQRTARCRSVLRWLPARHP